MKLIYITLPHFFQGEAQYLTALLRSGLELLHVRKPEASMQELEELIRAIPSMYYPRLVLHDHFALAQRYGLRGVHLNRRNPQAPEGWQGSTSRSCHSLAEVQQNKDTCNYVLLSPVFDSLSKPGYQAAYTAGELEEAARSDLIDSRVYALGGVTLEHLPQLRAWGFGGAALLGDAWRSLQGATGVEAGRMEQLTRHLHELLVAAAPRHPSVLSIAGSDCSGGAGIQADIKAISALGGYAASAITAVTSQNTLGVQGIFPLPPEVVEGQIRSVMDDLHVRAVKIGMVHDAALVRAIAGCLRRYSPAAVVCDPVMISTSGHRLMAEDTICSIEQELFPLSTLITPNLHEASMLCGRELHTVEEMKEEAMRLSERYGTSVLIKGGHLEGEQMCDVLASAVRPGTTECFVSPRIDSHNLHGTGCTLSSAIATRLAFGYGLEEAIGQAKEYMDGAIRRGRDLHVGHGHGPLWHFQE